MLFEAWSLVDSSRDELFLGSFEYLILGVGKGKGNSRGELKLNVLKQNERCSEIHTNIECHPSASASRQLVGTHQVSK